MKCKKKKSERVKTKEDKTHNIRTTKRGQDKLMKKRGIRIRVINKREEKEEIMELGAKREERKPDKPSNYLSTKTNTLSTYHQPDNTCPVNQNEIRG